MRNLLIDDVSLLNEYGVWISGNSVYNGSEPNVDTVKVPGRNGDLVYSNRRYNNFRLAYSSAIPSRFSAKFPALRAYLYSKIGYRKIVDSYFPDMYRMGRVVGATNPSNIGWSADAATFKIEFDCKPQHYYISGLTVNTFTASGEIINPTLFDALPIIRVYGTGSITVNGSTVTIGAHNYAYTDLDCEIQDAFCEDANLNAFVTVTSDEFPVLSPGTNNITIGSGITKVEITPRWWTL